MVKEEVNQKGQLHLEKTGRTKQTGPNAAQQGRCCGTTPDCEAPLEPTIQRNAVLVGKIKN